MKKTENSLSNTRGSCSLSETGFCLLSQLFSFSTCLVFFSASLKSILAFWQPAEVFFSLLLAFFNFWSCLFCHLLHRKLWKMLTLPACSRSDPLHRLPPPPPSPPRDCNVQATSTLENLGKALKCRK